jgi:hypothetical protein
LCKLYKALAAAEHRPCGSRIELLSLIRTLVEQTSNERAAHPHFGPKFAPSPQPNTRGTIVANCGPAIPQMHLLVART